MGLLSALTTALTGLQAAETSIDVVGNNVANSNTIGFKESGTIFATQFLQTQSIGSAPSASRGGTNPRQTGLGVRVAAISTDFSQGTIEISSNPLDVAIQGDGFLIVQGQQGGSFYTRNGQLNLNSNNEVVTTTGQRVLGYGIDDNFAINSSQLVPLSIPLGEERVAQATRTATLAGVLNPAVDVGATPGITTSATLGSSSIEFPDDADLGVDDLLELSPPSLDAGIATAFTTAGTGNPPAGVYQYRVTFVDEFGSEGAPTVAFPIDSTTAGDGPITLNSLPVANGTTFTDRRIYRTEAGGSTFFAVGSIGDATTTTFVDGTDDATLITGTALDTTTVDPGTYSYRVTFYDSTNDVETRPTREIQSVSVSEVGRRVRLNLSEIDPPADGNFTVARIYRNIAGQSENFRLIEGITIPADPAAANWSYIDSSSNASIESNQEVDLDGPKATSGTLLQDVLIRDGNTSRNLFWAQGATTFEDATLTFQGTKGGSNLDTQSFDISGNSTVQDLLDFMADALGIHEESVIPDQPLPPGAGSVTINPETGQISVTSNLGDQNELDVSLTAFQLRPVGSSSTSSLSLPFSQTQSSDGPGTNSEFIVYDSLGIPINVRVTTVLESRDGNSTTYRWFANSGNNEPGIDGNVTTVVGDGVLVFDQLGNLLEGPDARISVQRNDTASVSPLQITLNFGEVRSLAETDALGNPTSSLNVTRQDGFPPGVLTDFIVTESGNIQGQFSNGTQRNLGQIVMARFANTGGLQQVGDSQYNIGVNSGDPIFGLPGENGIGTLTAGAVELSNTDIGQNLIELILASTQYRGGARVISAAQELLDELLALRR